MKLLIKFPTRDRPEQFFQVLDKYYDLLENPKDTEFCITIDHDDKTMNNEIVLRKLDSYENLYWHLGNSKTKIEAVNADIEQVQNFDILLLASDDMIPQVKGYDEDIRRDMEKYFPNTDGILWYFDGTRRDLNTLSILGRNYYNRFGYIYHPEYKSLFCDAEFTKVGKILKKQQFIDKVIIKHDHPKTDGLNYDSLYLQNDTYYAADRQFYRSRRQIKFELKKSLLDQIRILFHQTDW